MELFWDNKTIQMEHTCNKIIMVPCKGIRIPEFGKCLLGESGIWENIKNNQEFWVLESGIQLKKSGIPLMIGIQNPSYTDKDWNPVPGIRNPLPEIQNPRLSWISLHD